MPPSSWRVGVPGPQVSVTLHLDCAPGEVRVMAAGDDGLLDYGVWRPGAPDGLGDLHLGRVRAVVPQLAGAFVALGGVADGFLPDGEGARGLGVGDAVAVRVTRSAQGGKGPRLSGRLQEAERAEASASGIGLVRRGPGAVGRLAALHPEAEVLCADPAVAAALRPTLGDRLRLVAAAGFGTRETPPDLMEEAAGLASPDVVLPGGMRASIHPTPALVAIDVDGGPAGAGQAKARAQMEGNRLAIPVLTRQIRLRSLSGAILIDFAGMPVRRRASLGPALSAALVTDPGGPRLLGFTALGLAEVLRPRGPPPLHELMRGPHAAGLLALRALVGAGMGTGLVVAPDVAAALEADPEAVAAASLRCGGAMGLRAEAGQAPGTWRLVTRGTTGAA